MRILAASLLVSAIGSAWSAAPPVEAPLAPAITLDAALASANDVARDKFGKYPGIYCGSARMAGSAGSAGGGATAVWVLNYVIPRNGRDVEAERKGWQDIWGTGEITVFSDRTARVTCDPKVIPLER